MVIWMNDVNLERDIIVSVFVNTKARIFSSYKLQYSFTLHSSYWYKESYVLFQYDNTHSHDACVIHYTLFWLSDLSLIEHLLNIMFS